ncbi:MAG: arginyltransferase [Gammaproteobacteria bacterium]|nr:arginyltransferase [Gammaproteobacteria bacterium]
MTTSEHGNRRDLKFFISTPSPCGYLKDRDSISLFADPKFPFTPAVYDLLIDHGFRRSADYVYRPHCPSCHLCVPVRVPVEEFKPSRSQKRVWKRNQDLRVTTHKLGLKQEHFDLYKKYQQSRHSEGEMARHDINRYFEFLDSEWSETLLMEIRDGNRLIGVAITDVVRRGLSAFYTFFDPEEEQRSLGTFAILWQIKFAKRLQLPWLYLGYWISETRKMNYKTRFLPLELRIDDGWQRITRDELIAMQTKTGA